MTRCPQCLIMVKYHDDGGRAEGQEQAARAGEMSAADGHDGYADTPLAAKPAG
jgi:hypothetical protein